MKQMKVLKCMKDKNPKSQNHDASVRSHAVRRLPGGEYSGNKAELIILVKDVGCIDLAQQRFKSGGVAVNTDGSRLT